MKRGTDHDCDKPILHICAPAAPVAETLSCVQPGDWQSMQQAVRKAIGPGWQVSGDPRLIWAPFLPDEGGRCDDAARAADLQTALADERVRAVVALRGGAWLLRVLERIDLCVLQRRRKPIWLFGFSEWTCLALLAARFPQVVSVHHNTPLYLLPTNPKEPLTEPQKQRRWRQVWASIRAILAGRDPGHALKGRLVTNQKLTSQSLRLVGGNLTLVAAMAGTKYQPAAQAKGCWLALEDVNESIGAIDRKLTQMRLAGLLEGARGVLVGGFHSEGQNLSLAVAKLLPLHLPGIPIVADCNFGHFWPTAPFPVGRPARLVIGPGGRVQVAVDWAGLARSV